MLDANVESKCAIKLAPALDVKPPSATMAGA